MQDLLPGVLDTLRAALAPDARDPSHPVTLPAREAPAWVRRIEATHAAPKPDQGPPPLAPPRAVNPDQGPRAPQAKAAGDQAAPYRWLRDWMRGQGYQVTAPLEESSRVLR